MAESSEYNMHMFGRRETIGCALLAFGGLCL